MCKAYGVQCPGFEKQLKWSTKHELLKKPAERRCRKSMVKPAKQTMPRSGADEDGLPLPSPTRTHDSQDGSYDDFSTPAETPSNNTLISGSPAADWPELEACGFDDLGFVDMPDFDFSLLSHGGEHYSQGVVPYHKPVFSNAVSSGVYGNGLQFSAAPEDVAPTPADSSQEDPIEEQDVAEQSASQDVSSSSASSSRFLQTYYRQSLPGRVSGLSDDDYVNHYFNNVCTIYSCYDCDANPFRTLVAQIWTDNAAVYLAIQSMALGHLANYYPNLASLGLQKRSQAWKYLQRDLQLYRVGKRPTETILLTLLLLGPSSAWHQASNVGMEYLFVARNVMQCHLQGSSSSGKRERLKNETFFQHALMYWEMLASLIDPVPITPLPGTLKLPDPVAHTDRHPEFPHPWTGISVEVYFALAEVGRMLRRRRTYSTTPKANHKGDSIFSKAEGEWAANLVSFLRSVELPSTEQIPNYEDIRTPKSDLILVADAYRFIGLLEIYGVFPQLLEDNVSIYSTVNGFEYSTHAHSSTYENDIDSSLVSIACHVLDIIRPIQIASSACRLLPLLLVSTAGQLRLPDSAATPNELHSQQHQTIVEARYLVESRMLVLSRKYPQKPLLQMMDIIKEVWQRIDSGDEQSHFMDVIFEKGWQTIMG